MRYWRNDSDLLTDALRDVLMVSEVATFDPLGRLSGSPLGRLSRFGNSVLRRNHIGSELLYFELVTVGLPLLSEKAAPLLVCHAQVKISMSEGCPLLAGIVWHSTSPDPRLMGQLRWVVETVVGAVVDPCEDTWRKPSNSAVTRPLSRLEFVLVDRLVSTVPVPGTLLLSLEEVELYNLLGTQIPLFWDPTMFARWVIDREDSVLSGKRLD